RAEQNGDEGSVANLGMITQYLQRSLDEHGGIITGNLLEGNKFSSIFFGSYIFALFRLGESELEDREDPFPRGRIPFLTIHQAKGLEFPVVVLGNPARRDHGVSKVECIARLLSTRSASEPLEKIYEFDTMRMFYVGLSRPKELLILAHFHGKGQQIYPAFRSMLNEAGIHRLPAFDLNTLSSSPKQEDSLPKVYSFTGDYLLYQKCPRQYMIFRKFGFVPSRSETMFFGSLVHRTLEDLHHELIRRRRVQLEGEKRD
ncbi:3'-5' exonuclease, partial [Anaerolinea sp.]|uniref:3'-5' exonuclease n=1 Tax=Anaerolinea sp. TaxID=1872519 RepID=UPI002ACD430A